jgi:hypothetical protein
VSRLLLIHAVQKFAVRCSRFAFRVREHEH